MPTIGWKEVEFMQSEGEAPFRKGTVVVRESNIASWQEGPDGRYALVADGASRFELGRFYPSL
jgi:hypothetical protein